MASTSNSNSKQIKKALKVKGALYIGKDEVVVDINDILGSGSFGAVYGGTLANEKIAIKVPRFRPDRHKDTKEFWLQKIKEYKQELDLMNKLSSEHTCEIIGAIPIDDKEKPQLWIVMPRLDGDLESLILGKECKRTDPNQPKLITQWEKTQEKKEKTIKGYKRPNKPMIWRYKPATPPLAVRLDWASQALRGVQWLHRMKDRNGKNRPVIHRDLKMANLLYKGKNTNNIGDIVVKVGDFGLSMLKPETQKKKSKDGGVGTMYYLGPEVLRGERFPSSDIYTFGLMLWEFITMTDIYASLGLRQLKEDVLKSGWREPIPSREELLKQAGFAPDHGYGKSAKWPDTLHKLIQSMWHHDPKQRITADQGVKTLDAIVDAIAIPDEISREIWRKFTKKTRLTGEKEYETFFNHFFKELGFENDEDTIKKFQPFLKGIFCETISKGNNIKVVNMTTFGKMMAAFGPIHLNDQQKNKNGFFKRLESTLSKPYFVGFLATAQAVESLTKKINNFPFPGRFLIRLSNSKIGSFAASWITKVGSKFQINHRVIHRNPETDKFFFEGKEYDSLGEFVTEAGTDLGMENAASFDYPYGYLFEQDDNFTTIGDGYSQGL